MKITVTILTKNNAATLLSTLESVKDFSEVVILDTGSTDTTLEIAQTFSNVKLFKTPFSGFGFLHNQASALAENEWILSLDSDEVLSPDLAQEILSLTLQKGAVYEVLRHNYLNQKQIRCCAGWYPDWIVRLYSKKETEFSEDIIHEKILKKSLRPIRLKNFLLHTPYRETADFLNKMQSYSTLFALQNQGKKKSSLLHALFHGWHAFIKSYFFKKGVFGGKEGFLISLYNAECSFYKYLKLAEKNHCLKSCKKSPDHQK